MNRSTASLVPLIVIFILCGILSAQSPAKKNIAVIELNSRGGLSQSEVGTLSDRLRSLLVKTQAFNVLDRGKMEEILSEQGFQQSGCTSTECVVEAGKILGVEQILAGTLGRVGSLYTVDVILIEVGTSRIVKSLTRDYRGEVEGLVALMESVSNELAQPVQEQKAQVREVRPPETGMLRITTKPDKAEIFLDDLLKGKTPLTLRDLKPGEYKIKLQLKGYEPLEEAVVIEPGKTADLTRPLKRLYALKVTSKPEGAKVTINNKEVGNTPYLQAVREGEKLRIQVQLENYKSWQKEITMKSSRQLDARLEYTDSYKKELAAKSAKKPDSKPKSSKKWWYIGGAAVVTSAAILVVASQGDESDDKASFPDPPGRP